MYNIVLMLFYIPNLFFVEFINSVYNDHYFSFVKINVIKIFIGTWVVLRYKNLITFS